jgi:hypothetical protein
MAIAIEADLRLHHRLDHIDVDIVRAVALDHPAKSLHSGDREIQRRVSN